MTNTPPDLEELGKQLDKARAEAEPKRREPRGDEGLGWRISIELVGAVFVTGAFGWYLDRVLGTKPWLMVAMLLLGIAAGIKNVFRAVEAADKSGERPDKD